MKNRRVKTPLCGVLLLITLTAACAKTAGEAENGKTVQRAQWKDRREAVQKQLDQIAGAARGHVGVSAVVLETDESVSMNPRDHFPMQSVYKLPICMAVMQQVEAGKLKLEQPARVEKADFIGPNAHSPIRDHNPNGVELSVRELVCEILRDITEYNQRCLN